MARERRNSAAAALAVAAAFAAAASGAEAPAATGGAANAGTPGTADAPSSFTLSTPMLRTAAAWIDPASADWAGRLPEVRLRMNPGTDFTLRDPSTTLGGMGVRGVEFALPRVPGLWVGVEEPADAGESRRATLSIQKQF